MSDNASDRNWADALEPRRSADRSASPATSEAGRPGERSPGWQSSPAWVTAPRAHAVGHTRAVVVLAVILGVALLVALLVAM